MRNRSRHRPPEIDSELTALLAAATRPTNLETVFRLRALTEIADQAATTTLIRLASELAKHRAGSGASTVHALRTGAAIAS